MRATEFLTEQSQESHSQLIFQSAKSSLWKVPLSLYKKAYDASSKASWEHVLPPPSHGDIYMLTGNTNDWETPEDINLQHSTRFRFFGVNGDNLVWLMGLHKLMPSMLKKLAQVTQTTNAPNLPAHQANGYVLFNGVVRKANDVLKEYELAPLSNNAHVYKIPRDRLWTVSLPSYQPQKPPPAWDTMWWIQSPIAGDYPLYSRYDIVNRYWVPPGKEGTFVKEVQELVARDNLTLKVKLPEVVVTKADAQIKPSSTMHRMLAYVSEHPGCSRSDWYVKHLGLSAKGMQGWTSDRAPDGVAASMGWIKNDGTGSKYSLSITAMGKLVLARLNSGKPVPYSKQV